MITLRCPPRNGPFEVRLPSLSRDVSWRLKNICVQNTWKTVVWQMSDILSVQGLLLFWLCTISINICCCFLFQETNVIIVHLIGAMMAFGLGTIYCWIQTYMSYKMRPMMNTTCMCHTRLIICIVTTVSFIGSILDICTSSQFSLQRPPWCRWFRQMIC